MPHNQQHVVQHVLKQLAGRKEGAEIVAQTRGKALVELLERLMIVCCNASEES